MTITAIKISDFDSTCLSASVNRVGSENFFNENFDEGSVFVAIPQELADKGIKKAVIVSGKLDDIVSITFDDGTKTRIKKISEDEDHEVAIKEALSDLALDGLDPNVLANWVVE